MPDAPRSFIQGFVRELIASLPNAHQDNHDHVRFGPLPRTEQLKRLIRNALRRLGFDRVGAVSGSLLQSGTLGYILTNSSRLEACYRQLADRESQDLLVRVLAFRCLGADRVRLPLSTPEYWRGISALERLADTSESLASDSHGWQLYRFDLSGLGYPIVLYHTAKGAYTQFVLQQYRCAHERGAVQAGPGDYVIDAGACWGDTALYFAHCVGPQGRVFSYEFIPGNLAVMRRNLALNPILAERVTLIENAVWSQSAKAVYYRDDGPSSVVRFEPFTGAQGQTQTLAIDDLVQGHQMPRVDFIKMDIEGAELMALRGAADTIRRYRPRLAISIYHRLSDFLDIPEYIAGLVPGYRFYIRHLTIHAEETVLFAEVEQG